MKQNKNSRYILLAISFALAAAGFLIQFWPLELLGILVAVVSGHWVVAIAIGLLLDIAYGAPTGRLHFLLFPFTGATLVLVLLWRVGKRYFLDTSSQETL